MRVLIGTDKCDIAHMPGVNSTEMQRAQESLTEVDAQRYSIFTGGYAEESLGILCPTHARYFFSTIGSANFRKRIASFFISLVQPPYLFLFCSTILLFRIGLSSYYPLNFINFVASIGSKWIIKVVNSVC